MLIIDGHEDIAYNALAWGRDIRLSAYTIREREAHRAAGNEGTLWTNPGGIAMSGLPELRRGGGAQGRHRFVTERRVKKEFPGLFVYLRFA